MKLEDIGFYTLSDFRAIQSSLSSPMWRCEMLITDKCNFKCPYCRGARDNFKGTMPLETAKRNIDFWAIKHLKNLRFSGGEPTIHPDLLEMVKHAKLKGVERIAISTNGSADIGFYKSLISAGVNDFSISLDACCSIDGDKMSGGVKGSWEKVTSNIKELSKLVYVTVGCVFTPENMIGSLETIRLAHELRVSDIRIISSAQFNEAIEGLDSLEEDILESHPILKYRVNNFRKGRNVRGIKETDSHKCGLVLDDSVIAGDYHFPCVIYMREGGAPIGKVGPDMRKEREGWMKKHNSFKDPICRKNCLDVCIDYNNKYGKTNKKILGMQ